jgi:hypothetical protein
MCRATSQPIRQGSAGRFRSAGSPWRGVPVHSAIRADRSTRFASLKEVASLKEAKALRQRPLGPPPPPRDALRRRIGGGCFPRRGHTASFADLGTPTAPSPHPTVPTASPHHRTVPAALHRTPPHRPAPHRTVPAPHASRRRSDPLHHCSAQNSIPFIASTTLISRCLATVCLSCAMR